jgi:hypothetical protein
MKATPVFFFSSQGTLHGLLGVLLFEHWSRSKEAGVFPRRRTLEIIVLPHFIQINNVCGGFDNKP